MYVYVGVAVASYFFPYPFQLGRHFFLLINIFLSTQIDTHTHFMATLIEIFTINQSIQCECNSWS